MTDSVFDSELARRIRALYDGGTNWNKLAKRAGLSETTLVRFAQRHQTISSASYKKLLRAFAPDLPGSGDPPQQPQTPVAPSPAAKPPFTATITLEGTYFSYDGYQLTYADASGNIESLHLPNGTTVSVEGAE